MEAHDITIPFKARYCTLGRLDHTAKQIWIVLHGYGQLAPYFIKKFKALEAHNVFVIAPEGLSRFYVDNLQPTGRSTDRVGATWMTKENRLADIENYLHYLNTLYTQVVHPNPAIPVTLLGFSQGAATVSRWVTDGQINFQRLILWAGVFPPDMNFDAGRRILEGKETYFVYGKADPFLNDARFAEQKMLTEKLTITPTVVAFEGKHDIDEGTLLRLV